MENWFLISHAINSAPNFSSLNIVVSESGSLKLIENFPPQAIG
jgi:hypothetical protein